MTAEQVADLVPGARWYRGGWRARCPVHQGRSNTSLSIREGREGRVLLHCWGGCDTKDILNTLGLTWRDISADTAYEPKPAIVCAAEEQIADLRKRLTPRELFLDLPITIVLVDPDNLDAGLMRALALAVTGELVQVVMK